MRDGGAGQGQQRQAELNISGPEQARRGGSGARRARGFSAHRGGWRQSSMYREPERVFSSTLHRLLLLSDPVRV